MPDRDRNRQPNIARLERKCSVCGKDLPAGVAFHVAEGCAKIHRDKVHREKGLKRD